MKLFEKSIMLKFGLLASIAFALALSGCSSSSSIEEQTKLIEYEKCLDSAHSFYLLKLETAGLSSRDWSQMEDKMKKGDAIVFDFAWAECRKYAP